MPLITWLFLAYASGLWLGSGLLSVVAWVVGGTAVVLALGRRQPWIVVPVLALVLGTLTGLKVRRHDDACVRRALRSGEIDVRLLQPAFVGEGASARATECGVRVRLSTRDAFPAGATLRVTGVLQRAPGGLRVRRAEARLRAAPTWVDLARARVSAAMTRRFLDDAPLARALVLAEQYDISLDLRNAYADAGIIHMVSVSGLHVSIIAGGLLAALAALGLAPRVGEAIAVASLAGYVLFIGAPPPAVRSAMMTSLGLCAKWGQRNASPWAVWALGSAVSLVDPHVVRDLGWQLSVSGMAGLMASGRLVEAWAGRAQGLRRVLIEGAVATGIATLVSAPIVSWSFGRISLAALGTNLLAAPLFNVAQPLLFVTVLLEPIEPVAAFLADATRGALALITLVAKLGALMPGAVLAVAPTAWTAVSLAVVAVCVVVGVTSMQWHRPVALALAILVVAAIRPFVPMRTGRMEVHLLDVGQGDAIAIRSPRGRWMLVDAGNSWDGGDNGVSVVTPWLRRFGGDVVHLVMTHPHADHVGGVRSLLRKMQVDTLWDTGWPGRSPAYLEALDSAATAGTVWGVLRAGRTMEFDGIRVDVLAPNEDRVRSETNPNEASAVLRLEFEGRRVLLTGDAEHGGEAWLLETYPADSLRAEVLKVGHHGSRTSSTQPFLDAVRPRVALVSVGAGNDYGHPDGEVIDRLAATGAAVVRTDEEGTVVLFVDRAGLSIGSVGQERQELPAADPAFSSRDQSVRPRPQLP